MIKKTPIILGIRITKIVIAGLIIAIVLIATSSIFTFVLESIDKDLYYFIIGISVSIAGFPFFISLILESRLENEKDMMFLEFSRDLVENVKSGTPISKAIFNVRLKNYASLNPYIDKLANQISLGIPVKAAFQTFARDIGSRTITRSVTIISESEQSGGQIETILESVVNSVSQLERLRKERKAAIFTLVVQGYIIFLIFIVIMLVMQFKILPIAANLSSGIVGSSSAQSGLSGIIGGGNSATAEELARPFIWLLITQGFFAGLVIGKLSEGRIRAGLKHSFVLVIISLLVQTGAKVVLG